MGATKTQKKRVVWRHIDFYRPRASISVYGLKSRKTGETFAQQGVYAYTEDVALLPIWRWVEGKWVE